MGVIRDTFNNLFRKEESPERESRSGFSYAINTFPMDHWNHWNAAPFEAVGLTTKAMRLSAVSACVEIRSDTVGKMPFYVANTETKIISKSHAMTKLLRERPNEFMTPFTFKKLLETWRLLRGNAYVYVARKETDGEIEALIPLDPDYVTPILDETGTLWYQFANAKIRRLLSNDSVIHLKGFSNDGLIGTSVLSRAASKIENMAQQEAYQNKYYANGATPSGTLTVGTSLSKEAREKMRDEWQKVYGGTDNAFKIAILDNGLEYKPITVTHRDSQFLETSEASIADIARYFLVPLYKLQAGKQTYQSNEQNSIEYVKTTISPTVKQYEEEFTFKTLFEKDRVAGLEVVINMNAEMRGDQTTRATWFNTMRNIGAYSVNDIRAYEDLPNVPGGDIRIMPLNSIPLERVDDYIDSILAKKGVSMNDKES